MTTTHKAIRSSGWKTDFIIGFPDGLFLLFFATQVIQVFPMEVQSFYTLQLCIWVAGSILVMFSAFQANKGDTQHDSSLMTEEERIKLQRLDINDHTITHIEQEMEKDARLWEQTLETEQVTEITFNRSRAIQSALFTGFFFLLGGALSLGPYLSNENFPAASQTSMMLVFLGLTTFSFIKAKITAQRPVPVILRYWLTGLGIFLVAWVLHRLI
ncbi:VIT1/CCC1 transporter family protein [Chitinophaga nivalis]|uniref:VIT1/CCC1 transporter family protein n=1 Tax=Chitinophaga nivalis TaxID=2991709 RepID=A0ABT3IKT3_9BACT|nr:VIT1/CCC1 transporter family protein [Chitinophaga nivalis]MCW3465729.1 VIT1/CCC1 transporter family protein [Chitinophaga nivalis]MCW3484580.1 VIT1/CCC1 transporter family protein [Chitinophaga nivalis]